MKYILFGAANPDVVRLLHSLERSLPDFEVAGFLDNDVKKHGTMFFGYPVLGGSDKVQALAKSPDIRFVNLINRTTQVRYEVSRDITRQGGIFGNLIHPTVDLSMTKVGPGAYITECVVLQACVEVGNNCSIHVNTVVGHESIIGNTVFIAPSVNISGCCKIGDATLIGANATLFPRITIGRWCTIGAGAVVTEDVPDYCVVFGNPAKAISKNDVGYENADVL
jgi:sugar O-acyltransferase (sialic acid O-acetyltransferase NeuD family)